MFNKVRAMRDNHPNYRQDIRHAVLFLPGLRRRAVFAGGAITFPRFFPQSISPNIMQPANDGRN